MHIGITGTPGTGKTTAAHNLRKNGYQVIDINTLAKQQHCITGKDTKRDTLLIDTAKLDTYLTTQKPATTEPLFFEGHITHHLTTMDKIIILRCHPHTLKKRLHIKNWTADKITENLHAETLDVILCEATQKHQPQDIFEINTTTLTPPQVTTALQEIIINNFNPLPKYSIGQLDWSEEILKD